MNLKYFICIFLFLGFFIVSLGALADEKGMITNNSTRVAGNNTTVFLNEIDSNQSIDTFNGTEKLSSAPNISASAQDDPITQRYAKGGVSASLTVGTMEGRGTDMNAAVSNTFTDHSGVNGYIKTFMKEFDYKSGMNP